MPNIADPIGLEMPDDFPAEPYNAANVMVAKKRDPFPPAWREWAGAWNAVAWRFKACADHDAAFVAAMAHGDGPAPPLRYIQERELFGFFVSGLAALESFAYAIHALGALLDATSFPMTTYAERRKITLELTTARLETCFPADALGVAMRRLRDHPTLQQWEGMRNILTHRSSPPRNHFMVMGGTSGTTIDVDLRTGPESVNVTATMTTARRHWLATTLAALVEETVAFVTRHAAKLPAACQP